MQAALDKLVPITQVAPVAADTLRKEREAVAARGGIVPKTAAKVATDEHTWDDFVHEQSLEVGAYPSEEQVIEFAVWMTMRRERACLAQRAEAGARLSGLVKRTVRNMLTELFAHAWPRRWPAYLALEKKEKAAYEVSILKQVDGLHKQAALALSAVRYGRDQSCDKMAELMSEKAELRTQVDWLAHVGKGFFLFVTSEETWWLSYGRTGQR